MTLDNKKILEILRQNDRDDQVQPSPRVGHIRIVDVNNDVTCAIENMGGMVKACELLAVTPDQINKWIDDHYVPEPLASLVNKHTGFSIQALQEPTFYVCDGDEYWPRIPTDDELTGPFDTCLKMRWRH